MSVWSIVFTIFGITLLSAVKTEPKKLLNAFALTVLSDKRLSPKIKSGIWELTLSFELKI